jgi:hypothetical protein
MWIVGYQLGGSESWSRSVEGQGFDKEIIWVWKYEECGIQERKSD